jgi:diguanylate cyclase (GGDEF)-like protein/hemerythrin-like metal-binding protein
MGIIIKDIMNIKRGLMKKFIYTIIIILFISNNDSSFANNIITIEFTDEQKEFIETSGSVKMVVDPDWYPYEQIDEDGNYIGIASDLINLISVRTGLEFEIIRTKDWDETIDFAKSGQAQAVSFLNSTEERSKWLLFTQSYFIDPNVLITREEHDYISNLSRLSGEIVVLPNGTSVEEKLRKDYPHLEIITVKSEKEALSYVENNKADMTIRSLTMAAYVIKNGGNFNLKIAGDISDYSNEFRIGVTNNNQMLVDILNLGISTITELDVQNAINNHISINIIKGFDYKLFIITTSIFFLIFLISIFWIRRINQLNKSLEQKNEDLQNLSDKLLISENLYKNAVSKLENTNDLLEKQATTDVLTGIRNRNYFNIRVMEEIERSKRYGSDLSLILIDLDHFKRINDTYGHDIGDDVIIKFTKKICELIRKTDLFARWGGEEFIILLPETDLLHAIDVGNKLREEIQNTKHINDEVVTISLGVSNLMKFDTMESWFRKTDRALYHGKNQGRNLVCISEGIKEWNEDIYIFDEKLESSNEKIDNQHYNLLKLSKSIVKKFMNDIHNDYLYDELLTLIENIKIHFIYEEQILERINYEQLQEHKNIHLNYLNVVKQLVNKANEGKLLMFDVLLFIVDEVIINHLLNVDFDYIKMFIEKGDLNESFKS